MDPTQFDRIVRLLAQPTTRRGALGGMMGGVLAVLGQAVPGLSKDRHQRKAHARKARRRHRDQQSLRNEKQRLRTSTHRCTPKIACLHWCLSHFKGKAAVECITLAAKCKGPCQECGVACSNPCGKTLCGQRCVDLKADPNNCGACGHACASGQTCAGGTCGCTGSNCGCPPGQKPCNGGCIPTTGCCQNTDCNDNNLCTADTCVNNLCLNTPISCDDGNPCTTDSCDPATGCQHSRIDDCCRSDADCEDGNACTINTCSNGTCIDTAVTCDDGDPCTTDGCDPDVGCVSTPIDGCCRSDDECPTPDPCTIARCTGGTCVLEPVVCDDGNPCTVDTCVNGTCQFTPISCDDGLQCTADTCVNGACVHTVDLSRCPRPSACQSLLCASGHDCERVSHDDLCPAHPAAPSCLVPKCTNAGCTYVDTCGVSHPDCQGCASCSCNIALNKCVKTCPS